MDVQKLTYLHTFQGPQLITIYHLLIEYFTSGITQIRLNVDPKRVFKLGIYKIITGFIISCIYKNIDENNI